MASLYELEAMMVTRDQILAKVLDVFVGPKCGQTYIESVAKTDELIRGAASEVG